MTTNKKNELSGIDALLLAHIDRATRQAEYDELLIRDKPMGWKGVMVLWLIVVALITIGILAN